MNPQTTPNGSLVWTPLAGPYRSSESWMLKRVIADLRTAGKDYLIVHELSNGRQHRFIGQTVCVKTRIQPLTRSVEP